METKSPILPAGMGRALIGSGDPDAAAYVDRGGKQNVLTETDWRQVALAARMELELLRQAGGEVVATDASLPEEARALRQRLIAIESSQSWRLTAPLRAAINALRAVRGRLKSRSAASAAHHRVSEDVMRARALRLKHVAGASAREDWQALLNAPGEPL